MVHKSGHGDMILSAAKQHLAASSVKTWGISDFHMTKKHAL
jgi:hypothetical protein